MNQLMKFYKEKMENKNVDINRKILAMSKHHRETVYIGNNEGWAFDDNAFEGLAFDQGLVNTFKKMKIQVSAEPEQVFEEILSEELYAKTIPITTEDQQSFLVTVVYDDLNISNMGVDSKLWIDFNQMIPKEQEQISA